VASDVLKVCIIADFSPSCRADARAEKRNTASRRSRLSRHTGLVRAPVWACRLGERESKMRGACIRGGQTFRAPGFWKQPQRHEGTKERTETFLAERSNVVLRLGDPCELLAVTPGSPSTAQHPRLGSRCVPASAARRPSGIAARSSGLAGLPGRD
jgi:hypothetical protein